MTARKKSLSTFRKMTLRVREPVAITVAGDTYDEVQVYSNGHEARFTLRNQSVPYPQAPVPCNFALDWTELKGPLGMPCDEGSMRRMVGELVALLKRGELPERRYMEKVRWEKSIWGTILV